MKKIITTFFILSFLFGACLLPPVGAVNKFYPKTTLTGGGGRSVDGIHGDRLQDGDGSIVITSGGVVCIYRLNSSSGAAETSETPCPFVIDVDTDGSCGADCRWELAEVYTPNNFNDSIYFTNGSWNCDLDNDGSCSDTDEASWDIGIKYLQFDQSTDDNADSLIVKLPDNFDGTDDTVSTDLYWFSDTNSGAVVWCLEFRSADDGNDDAWSAWNTSESCITDTVPGTAGYVGIASDSSVTNTEVDSWSGGDIIQIRVRRDENAGGDTLADDAQLVGLSLNFRVTP